MSETRPKERSTHMIAGEDIRRLYLLLLRREPESILPEQMETEQDLFAYATGILGSAEFVGSVIAPAMNGHLSSAAATPLDRCILAWACRRLQLDRETRRRLVRAWSWMQVYDALLADPILLARASLPEVVLGVIGTSVWASSCLLQGEIDSCEGRVLRGWARRQDADGEPLQLQVWLNGSLQTMTTTGVYRPDLADRFQSEGLEGFEIWLPSAMSGEIRCEVRDATSKLLIGRREIFVEKGEGAGDLAAVRQELSVLRLAIETLEAQLPRAIAGAALPLEDYAVYYDRFRRHAPPTRLSETGIAILIDATGCRPEFVEDALLSAASQSHDRKRIVVGVHEELRAFIDDLACRISLKTSTQIGWLIVAGPGDWRHDVQLSGDDQIVQLMPGDGVMHPHCLSEVAAWFDNSSSDSVYFDEDELGGFPGDEASARPHISPVLKPAFDLDLLLQTAYAGAFVAFRHSAWSAVSPMLSQKALGALGGSRLLLELARNGAGVDHLPEILASRQQSDAAKSVADWAECVRHFMGDHVKISSHSDILGAVVPSSLTIRRPVLAGTSAAIIIPTRDRLDLLRPCVDSILERAADNVAEMSIALVDHETSQPGCMAYMGDLEQKGLARRIPFTGSFNWALMNNLAAWQCEADVLIFLNNDTIAISEDWLDALVSEAMRPDVGVVGGRLIYADGRIQHAGFVSLDAKDNFLTHEGVGARGEDVGYLGRHALVHETIAVTGACLAVRRDVFVRLGGFDAARFPIEGNDVDFCFKARAAGLKVLYSPHATLFHLESRTRTFDEGERQRSSEASRRLWNRWGNSICPDPHFNRHFDRRGRPFTRLRVPHA